MKKPLLILITSLLPFFLHAQIEYPGEPWSRKLKLKSTPAVVAFPGLSGQTEKSYMSSFSNKLKAMVFAYPFDTLLTADRDGSWETLYNGSRIWRISLHSPGAKSLNLIFNRFRLPSGAGVYIYTPDYQTIRGAFTSENKTVSGVMATVPLPGDQVTVELDLPPDPEFMPEIEISKVSHDFKGFFSAGSDGLKAGTCNVDINCPAGASWQVEKKAVVKFIRGGVWLCTGTLINNTRIDGRPLLLSANHTIGSQSHAEQTIFFFRYERPSCENGNGTLQYTLSGSTLLATTGKLDFSLVELSSAPPKSYEPYFAGWDRTVVSFLDSVTCIHHPNGMEKKISKSYHVVTTGDFGGGYDSSTHWKISAWDLGTTEPGSSGSPLFNKDHRIVGDLTGGDASCTYNYNDYFQKFSISWDKYADSSGQLKCWLDPEGTGLFVLNGYDPFSGGKPVANFSIRPQRIQAGRKVYCTDLSTGLPDTWEWEFEGGDPENSAGQNPGAVKFLLPGSYHISLYVQNGKGWDSLKQTITVFDDPSYTISETRIVPERQILLADQSQRPPWSVIWLAEGSSMPLVTGTTVELNYLKPGEYSVNEIVEFPDFTDTLIHYNQVKVINDVIAFRSKTVSNVKPDEHTEYMEQVSKGYLPGSNDSGITGYAEAFRNETDTVYNINGIGLSVAVLSSWAKNYYLPIIVWNANHVVLLRDSVLVSGYKPGNRFTKWLKAPVAFDSLLYVGYEVKPWNLGTFVSEMATDRGEKESNTAYVINKEQWQSATDYAGIHTSWDIALETSASPKRYQWAREVSFNQDSINIINGIFKINLGSLTFKQAKVHIFNLTGQQFEPDVTVTGNQITFSVSGYASGIYVARILIDQLQISKKFFMANIKPASWKGP